MKILYWRGTDIDLSNVMFCWKLEEWYSEWQDTFRTVHQIPRFSRSSNYQSPISLKVFLHSTFLSQLLVQGLSKCRLFSIDFWWWCLKYCLQNFIRASLEPIPKAFLITEIVFIDKCPIFKQNLLHIHFECDSHTMHMFTK